MKIKFKKLNKDAVLPKIANKGDAGADLTAITRIWDSASRTFLYGTGLAVKIPDGHVGLIFPRSSIYKQQQSFCNAVGVIDSQYTGELQFRLRPTSESILTYNYNVGERVGQLVIVPYVEIEAEEVDELVQTERGIKGWGSSGT